MRLVLFVVLAINTHAQWLDYISPKVPRTRDGKINLVAPVPRAANGKPDLSGVWKIEPAPPGENERLFGERMIAASVIGDDARTFNKFFLNFLVDFKPEDSPMKPATEQLFLKNRQTAADNPSTNCLPQSIPRADLTQPPFKIIQTPEVTTILYEVDFSFRQVYTDGRKLPVDPLPIWTGYSVGKWDGDTFVVDTAGFNDKSWLDAAGHPHSESLKVQERFRRRDFGHMDLQITIDDPVMYTRPVTYKVAYDLIPSDSLLEYVCNENEKSRDHLGK